MERELTVQLTTNFQRAFSKLPSRLQQQAITKDQRFRKTPFHPSLRTHKLKGPLDSFWSYSVSYSYRILFRFLKEHEVLYYDIGTHEIYR